MPLHTPYCADSEFCICWMEPQPRGLRSRGDAQVAVIGAGFAGLCVADQLVNRYGFHNVVVYEALDRAGGRAHTVKFGQGNVELGAQYIQNLPNSMLLKMAQDCGAAPVQSPVLNLLNHRTKMNFKCAIDVALREGGSSVDQKILQDFRRLLLTTEIEASKGKLKLPHFPKEVKLSLGAVQTYEYNEWKLKRRSRLSREQSRDLDLLFKFASKAAELDYGCDDWNDVSLASTSQFYTLGDHEADFQLIPVQQTGYSSLIDQLVARLPKNCLQLKSPCLSINWQGPRVDLEFKGGSSVTAEHVIVTVPLGVLKECSMTLFSPPLPLAKKLAMDGLGVGNVEKLFARFEKPFWKNIVRRYELLWGEPHEEESEELKMARCFFLMQPVATSSNVVCFWTTGDSVKKTWKSQESMLKLCVQKIVLRFFPTVDEKFAYPEAILRSNWSGNKYFCGSYSYYSMTHDSHKHGPAQLAEPLYAQDDETPLVLFAGEATCVHCYGTTHGALASGLREARRLHVFYKKRSNLSEDVLNLPQHKPSCFGGYWRSWGKR